MNLRGRLGLLSVAPEMWNYELCLTAINDDLSALDEIKKNKKQIPLNDEEYKNLFNAAKDKFGIKKTFHYFPPEMRTYKLFLELIKKNETALNLLAKPGGRAGLKSGEYEKLCQAALKEYGLEIFDHLSEKIVYDLCLSVVTEDVTWLKILKKNRRRIDLTTDEYTKIFFQAFELHGSSALYYFPAAMYTYDIFRNIVKEDYHALKYLKDPNDRDKFSPNEYYNLCLETIDTHAHENINKILHYIDSDILNYDLLLTAVTKNFRALKTAKKQLKQDEYLSICKMAVDKYSIAEIFYYLPSEMRTYDAYISAANADINVLEYFQTAHDKEQITMTQYSELALIVIKKDFFEEKDYVNLSDDMLRKFIAHYESVNKFNDYKMPNIETFFSENIGVIAAIYTMLGNNTFLLMEKILVTSDDILKRFFSELTRSLNPMPTSCSKNISRLFDIVTHKNARQKESQLKLYLFLSNEEREKINLLLGDNNINIETIPNEMRKLLIMRFYDYLTIPYKEKNAMDSLSNEQLADLYGLLKHHEIHPNSDQNQVFFSMLKMYLQDIPFECLHQPEEMKKYGDTYMVNMAEHNKKIRESLAAGGIDVDKTFAYKKQVTLTFDEYNKQKILEILASIYKKINESSVDNKNINNLLEQIKKGKDAQENKLLRMLSEANLKLLENIPAILPHIKTEYLELLNLFRCDLFLMSPPESGEYKPSDRNHLYLYKNEKEEIWYRIKDLIFDTDLVFKLEIPQSIKDKNEFKFDQPEISPLKCENSAICKTALGMTSLDFKPEILKNYKPRRFHIKIWDKTKIETLFLGDYLSCCLATTGTMKHAYAQRVFDDAFFMPVIIEESTQKPVHGAWMFFVNAIHPPSLDKTIDTISNFAEINAGIVENKELTKCLVANLLNYIDQFTQSIHAAEFVLRPLSHGMIPDYKQFGTFARTHNLTIDKIGGYFGSPYFLDALTTQYFYQFDPAQFIEQVQKYIVPEPELKNLEIASHITLGFAAKSSNESLQDLPIQKTPGSTFSNQ